MKVFGDSTNFSADDRGRTGLAVDIPPMPDLDHQDHQLLVLNLANDPEIAHTVSPQFPKGSTLEGFAETPRVISFCNALPEKIQNAF